LAARDVSKLEPSAQKIRKETGRHVETLALDAVDFRAVQQFSERLGPAASILHYNAAAIQKMDVLETPVETTQRNLSVDILVRRARRDQVLRALYGAAAQRNHSAHWRRFSTCSECGISVVEYRQGRHSLLGTSSLSSTLRKRNPYRNSDGHDDGESWFRTGDGCG